MDLAYSSTPEEFNAIDVPPSQGSFGIDDARVIYPGDPYRSTLFYRLATTGTGHMPKIWTRDNDRDGLILVHDWIRSLKRPSDQVAARQPLKNTNADSSTSISDALREFTKWLRSEQDDPAVLQQARAATASGDPLAAALFERFLPEGERRKRLGNEIDRDRILAMVGDADRGRTKFFEDASQQCILCHRLEGRGRNVGPDLDAIATKRTRVELLESVVDPSKVIDPKFTSHLVLTDDGRVLSGLQMEEDERSLLLRSADGQDHRIVKDSIESHRLQSESLMPQGLAAEMTADELADLLAFLSSLK